MYPLGESSLYEGVDFAVEHGWRIGAFNASAQVFHNLIGLQHIGADLVSPANFGLRRLLGLGLLLTLLQLQFVEPRFKHRPGGRPVLMLRALVLALHDNAGGQMGDAYRGVRGVDMLAARAA